MGRIRGDVDAVGMANLLQMLSTGKCEGTLVIMRNLDRKVIQFNSSGMRLVNPGARRDQPLGEMLVRSGKITQAKLEELLPEQRRTRTHLGLLLVRRGLVSKSDVENALRDQIADEMYDIFTWKEATFEYTGTYGSPVGEAGQGLSEVTLDTDVTFAILQASRLADELSRIEELIPDVRMVPVGLKEIPVNLEELNVREETVRAVLPLIDNLRSVRQLIAESGCPGYQVLGILYAMVERGALRIQDMNGQTAVRRRSSLAAPGSGDCARRVAVLGDSPASRRPTAAALRTAGLEVIEGDAGGDFAELGGEGGPAMIVLCLRVDAEGTLDHCARLRKATPSPFLAFARDATRATVESALRSGARVVAIEPVKDDFLVERVLSLLKK
jgi:CheY-like chemotaxis protein